MSTVFLVWGRNPRLAKEVMARLNDKGFSAVVGGDADTCDKFHSHYLGQRIVEQMNRCQHAIVLAQWPPEDNNGDSIGSFFRPNLMFEWGFLLGRFQRQPSLHVFLIGIKSQELPSDLCGSFTHEINWKSDPSALANEISAIFLDESDFGSPDPMQPFCDWSSWRSQVETCQAPDAVLGVMLLHGIQPAYYRGELDIIRELTKQLATRSGNSQRIREACTVANAACDYYELTSIDNHAPDFRKMYQIEKLLTLPDPIAYAPDIWIHVVRLDLLGIVRRRLSEASKAAVAKTYLESSRQALIEAVKLLEMLPPSKRHGCWHLWRGYILRNLGRACSELGDMVNGKTFLEQSLEARDDALRDLNAMQVSKIIQGQLFLERLMVGLDLVKYGHSIDTQILDDVTHMLREVAPQTQMWEKTMDQALSLASDLKASEIEQRLQNLKDLYGTRPKRSSAAR